jgi:hypothetical protein
VIPLPALASSSRKVVDEAADHRDVGGTNASVPLCCGRGGQQRRPRFAGDRLPVAQLGGLANATRGFRAGDAQPVGQRRR